MVVGCRSGRHIVLGRGLDPDGGTSAAVPGGGGDSADDAGVPVGVAEGVRVDAAGAADAAADVQEDGVPAEPGGDHQRDAVEAGLPGDHADWGREEPVLPAAGAGGGGADDRGEPAAVPDP